MAEATIKEAQRKVGEHLPENLVEQMVNAGVHFGHRASRWNPAMKRFIYAKRNLIHIIDLKQTVRGLLRGTWFLEQVTRQGGEILCVGTKWQAQDVVKEVCEECGLHFVTQRWLGGTLTNHPTIRSRLKRLEELESLEATGQIEQWSKKMQVRMRREKDKIYSNLHGVRRMEKLPTAVLVVDARRETIALKEANKLGIPTLAIIDTDSDPELVDIPIAGNDDAQRSLELLLRWLGEAVKRGREHWESQVAVRARAQQEQRPPRGQQQQGGAGAAAAPPPAPAAAPKLGIRKVQIPTGKEGAGADGGATPPAGDAPAGDAPAQG